MSSVGLRWKPSPRSRGFCSRKHLTLNLGQDQPAPPLTAIPRLKCCLASLSFARLVIDPRFQLGSGCGRCVQVSDQFDSTDIDTDKALCAWPRYGNVIKKPQMVVLKSLLIIRRSCAGPPRCAHQWKFDSSESFRLLVRSSSPKTT